LFTPFLHILLSFIKEDFNRFFKTLSIVISIIFGALTIFTKTLFFSHLLTPYHILLAIYAMLVISSLTKSLYNKREGANLILVGFIFFFIAMANDILHSRNIINTSVLMNYGVFSFVIVQAFFLAKKSVAAYRQIEQLSSNLLLINQSLERFVPNAFLTLLRKENISEVSLGDNIEKEMSIMFSDIRSFTSISEKLKPQEAFEFINEYLKKMGPVIRKHNGFIDKYIGDGIMALLPKNPQDAINASIEMMEQLIVFNKENEKKNLPHIDIGVGIHTGMCMLGTVGEYERMDTTVISDAVNLAARIESLTKTYKTPILISEETFKGLIKNKNIKVRYIGIARVKGKSITTKLYEILVRHVYNDEGTKNI
jgi:class 3 adenylate cyclase